MFSKLTSSFNPTLWLSFVSTLMFIHIICLYTCTYTLVWLFELYACDGCMFVYVCTLCSIVLRINLSTCKLKTVLIVHQGDTYLTLLVHQLNTHIGYLYLVSMFYQWIFNYPWYIHHHSLLDNSNIKAVK